MSAVQAPAGQGVVERWMIADPRGPSRTIVGIIESAGPTLIELSCGHVGEFANHFTYKLGTSTRCFQCRTAHDNLKHGATGSQP